MISYHQVMQVHLLGAGKVLQFHIQEAVGTYLNIILNSKLFIKVRFFQLKALFNDLHNKKYITNVQ